MQFKSENFSTRSVTATSPFQMHFFFSKDDMSEREARFITSRSDKFPAKQRQNGAYPPLPFRLYIPCTKKKKNIILF